MKRILAVLSLLWTCLGIPSLLYAQEPTYLKYTNHSWVDSVYQSLTPRERIAQLLIVPSPSLSNKEKVAELIRKYKVGGVIFFKAKAVEHQEMIHYYRSQAETPLMFALDAEWGIGMRTIEGMSFPYAMTLGAVQEDKWVYEMGKAIGRHMKQLGMHINFGPVVDVNNNPNNPVISYRSFGEDPKKVAELGKQYVRGLQEEGVLAVAKHFPGHGDTSVDSHHDLPVITHQRARLDSVELYPFRQLVDAGVGGVMSAHLQLPAIDDTPHQAASLSKKILNILREDLQFKGLVFTDGIHMKGITKHRSAGEAHAEALIAGNDVVEFTREVEDALIAIEKAIKEGRLTSRDIEEKCRKVLAFKYWAERPAQVKIQEELLSEQHLIQQLNSSKDKALNRKLSEGAITMLRNVDNRLPIQEIAGKRIAVVSIGSDTLTTFQKMAAKYTQVDFLNIGTSFSSEKQSLLLDTLKSYDHILVGIHDLFMSPKVKEIVVNLNEGKQRIPTHPFGITEEVKQLVEQLSQNDKVILTVFANPYALNVFQGIAQSKALLMTYQDTPLMQEIAAQVIFGALPTQGKLPVTVNEHFKVGSGIFTKAIGRLGFADPENVQLDGWALEQLVDSLAMYGLEQRAYPGCQVLVAKEGKVILQKSYGFHTYYGERPVENEDLYDLASVTKVSAPLPAIMKLSGQGVFDMDEPFSRYWKGFQKDPLKRDITFKEVLAHQAGLYPYISYWSQIDKIARWGGLFKQRPFALYPSKQYTVRVGPQLYAHKKLLPQIYKLVNESAVKNRGTYKYSGLSFVLYPEMISSRVGQPFDDYLKETFYGPLGATTLGFNPYELFDCDRIIPTENDIFFRHGQMDGFVHDEAAAVLGGVSGNAGLFSNALDLAKLMQMYLQEGYYGGKQYIAAEVMKEFTSVQFPENDNRRGLGFDKPLLNNETLSSAQAYPCLSASPKSFGHTGFTGTMAWVDPAEKLVFIFLSNRVHPTRDNRRLYKLNIRTEMLEGIYGCHQQTIEGQSYGRD
ncbi:glycoside hydrolase family 3 N-terminal domain-containing protein [Algivirga pacifica]|uniref:beta-N-acetylhexosaminidase n=1 Tax=Algivirga pacifica TaxID=1162670 RepID=A0ABP9D8A6_9BACT